VSNTLFEHEGHKILREKLEFLTQLEGFEWINECNISEEIILKRIREQIVDMQKGTRAAEEMLLEKTNYILGLNNKLRDKDNCIDLLESRIRTLEEKFEI